MKAICWKIIDQFDGVIAGDDPFTARVLEQGKNLKIVAKWGIGVDSIDLTAAKQLGIPVVNTPGAFPDEVADVALGYIILLARQLHKLDRSVREGRMASNSRCYASRQNARNCWHRQHR